MIKRFGNWFSGLSKAGKAGFVLASLFVVGVAASPNSKPSTQPNTPIPTQTQTAQTKAATIEKKTVSETELVAFEKTTVNDSTLAVGKSVVKVPGVNGVRTLTYEVTYTDGVQTDKQLIKNEVTTEPINEVTSIGTKQPVTLNCPNGTYTNSAGNEVCSPYSAPSVPAGATARCHDGSYSFSQSRSGTCSHHGGVAEWL